MERLNEGSAISPDDTENSGITDAVREEDRVQLLAGHATEIASVSRQSDAQFCIQTMRDKSLETPESILTPGDVPPERAPKPCRLTTQDSAYDSGGSQESISLENDNAFDGESVILKEHAESWEIDMKRLKVSDFVLGEGEFGVVKRGTYRGLDGRTCNVAVKQLKDGTSITDKNDLLGEIQMLKQAGWHPNIVALIGACTQEEEILVVTELIPNGSLEKFLKSKRMVGVPGEASTYENVHFGLNDRELLVIAYQIALGMQHLEEKKCIHRDLSARNVFIGENLVAKVGDFGLARDISFDGIYTKTSPGKVPWRWMALESLKDRVYTSKSDVWSYGIVLWEIATYGEVPYPNIIILADLISWLSMGNRMSRPEHSSDELYEMMRLCL
ncbi:unnamed protein product [Porites evermanni]|uniref:Protein kinase domain-containing protein n=1 Tax=Porites evermanni TaxID=104178 RepID=A0ABN8QF62_9CNID|nr:unnamed protein product [Porites evermanni]